jgi:hypothetical protein
MQKYATEKYADVSEERSLQSPADAGSSLADFSTLKMEVVRSQKKSVYTRSTQHHVPQADILHTHRRENLKYYRNTFSLKKIEM